VQVDCADGTWTWHESGEPLDFEHTDRYLAQRRHHRFDRELLIEYLASFGLDPDDPSTFGAAVLLSGDPTSVRAISVAERRVELGL
jgi:hypothetical protein